MTGSSPPFKTPDGSVLIMMGKDLNNDAEGDPENPPDDEILKKTAASSSSEKVNKQDDDDGTITAPATPTPDRTLHPEANHRDGHDYHDYKSMSGLEMLKRQLTIFRLRKNLDPSWKQKARDSAPAPYLALYVASSFFWMPVGILMLVKEPSITKAFSNSDFYPWHVFGGYLILQSIVTHFSDTVYVDRASYWHPTDRVCALFGAVCVVSSAVTLLLDENRSDHVAGLSYYVSGMILSAAAFSTEWKLKANGEIASFVLANALWHTFLPVGLFIFLLTL